MYSWVRGLTKNALQGCFPSGSFLWRLPKESRAIALTFDDGPHPDYTPQILDLLFREGCKATFFVIGKHVKQYPKLVKRIADDGHALGVHGYEHLEIVGLSAQSLTDELNNCRLAIREASGIDTTLFRPPRGKVSGLSALRVMKQGYCLVHWSKTYSDYNKDGVDKLVARIEADPMCSGDIILLHDHNQYTVDALATVIPRVRAEGMQFQTINLKYLKT